MKQKQEKRMSPWLWIPPLYIAKGIPFVVLMTLSLIIYKRMGMDNVEITFYTSWLLLPWVIKPLWRPLIDLYMTRRFWILVMELLMGVAMMGVAFTIPCNFWLYGTLFFFWLLAFGAATHDIAIDSFYQLGVPPSEQLPFVRVRRFFYRLSMIFVQGMMVMVAGNLEVISRNIRYSWSFVVYILAGVMIFSALIHMVVLPRSSDQKSCKQSIPASRMMRIFKANVTTFVRKPYATRAILFLFLYLVAEGLMAKISVLFLIDRTSIGGLGLSLQEFGFVQGTVGVIALVYGGIVGNNLVRHYGLRRCIIPMAVAIALPKLVFVYLSHALPESFLLINLCVAVEQFGFGFGMTAYIMYLVYYSQGERAAAHYGIGIAMMSFTMMFAGMFSGLWVKNVGYRTYFLIVLCMSLLAILTSLSVKIDTKFGIQEKKHDDKDSPNTNNSLTR